MFQAILKFFRKLFGFNSVSVPVPVPQPEAPEPLPTTPVVSDSSGVSANGMVQIGDIISLNEQERQMCVGAIIIVRDILASAFFKEEILAASFTNTNGMTNLQIYNKYIYSKLIVNIHMFYGSWYQNHVARTIGYDTPGDEYVNANRYFVQDSVTLASLVMHETAHALGWSHASSTEYTSVPYMMNKISETVMKKLGLDS